MLSQQEISDRFEIQDLCYHYADLVDQKKFELLRDEVFTADAHIDYSVFGGSVGNVDETLAYLSAAVTDEVIPNSQHLNANPQITVNGDSATGRVMCLNPMEMAVGEGETQTFLLGLWYVDEYRRTDTGWRISRRAEERSWVLNTPEFMSL